jgi:hypothetical protein
MKGFLFTHTFVAGPVHVTIQVRRLNTGKLRWYIKNLHLDRAHATS